MNLAECVYLCVFLREEVSNLRSNHIAVGRMRVRGIHDALEIAHIKNETEHFCKHTVALIIVSVLGVFP